jgi:hypothetical protein
MVAYTPARRVGLHGGSRGSAAALYVCAHGKLFVTRPIRLAKVWPAMMAGVLLFLILQVETAIRHRWDRNFLSTFAGFAE